MRDSELTPFELDVARRLQAYSDIDVPPSNALSIARETMTARRPFALGQAWAALRPILRVAIATALLSAGLVGLLVIGGQLLDRRLAVEPTARPTPTPPPVAVPVLDPLEGAWLATKPDNLSFGDPSGPATLTLLFEANVTNAQVSASSASRIRLDSTVGPAPEGIQFTTRSPGDPVSIDGVERPGCPAGGSGTYTLDLSADGLFLTLSAVSDTCAARTAVLARTWVRSLGAPSSGGLGVIDALNQPFLVSLPEGSYSVDLSLDAITVVQPVPELQFLAVVDPQGFNDPCDTAAGRYEVAPGADAFVAYFQQLNGFTVDSTTELRVDGHRAVRLVLRANADATCPSGALLEYQAKKSETSDRSWFVRPGDTDSLVIVELPDSTLMFEVLPAPNPVEAEVIGSIRFLDALPTSP